MRPGGRQLGAWVAGLSYAASTSSAWVLLGFSGFVFSYGYSALWMMPGIWIGYVIMWLNLGPTIRIQSSKNQWVTPTDFISANVDSSKKKNIAILAAFLITFCFIFYIEEAKDFYIDKLGFKIYLEHKGASSKEGPNVLGLPHNLTTKIDREVYILHRMGGVIWNNVEEIRPNAYLVQAILGQPTEANQSCLLLDLWLA